MAIDFDRFRLRIEDKIVGYKKQIQNSVFYSKDEYGWSGNSIEYTLQDKFSEFFDINRKAIYSKDIIEFINPTHFKYGLIIHDEILDSIQVLNMESNELVPISIREFLYENPFVFKSFHFIQPKV